MRRAPAAVLLALALLLSGGDAGPPPPPEVANLQGVISDSEHGGEHGAATEHGHGEHSEHAAAGHGEDSESGHGHGEESSHGHEASGHGGHESGGHESGHESGHGEHESGGHGGHGEHHPGTGAHGHGHGHGGHGHHASVTVEERSIAYLMMFSVSAIMVLLFFLNYSDPDVRCASSKMACTAVSVYIAVLVNQALFSFIFDQLLTGKDYRGMNMEEEDIQPWMRVSIGSCIFLITLFGLNMVCWRWKRHPNRLVAASQLGAHMVAWAGINAFGALTTSDAFYDMLINHLEQMANESGKSKVEDHGVMIKYIAVILLGFASFIAIFYASRVIRTKVLERAAKKEAGEKGKKPPAKPAPKKKGEKEEREEEEPWLEELGEAEREAMALVCGFLTQQAVVYAITGKVHIPIHGLHDKRNTTEVMLMVLSACFTFGVLLVVAMVWRKPGRSSFNFRGYLAMTMAWLSERSGEWFMHIFFDNLAFARIWSAFMLTGLAIVATVVVDHFADGTQDRKNRGQTAKDVKLEELVALDKYVEGKERMAEKRREVGDAGSDSSTQPLTEASEPLEDTIRLGGKLIEQERLEKLHEALRDETPTDLSVQTLTVGFSVLVGIVWDMAFESAEQLIVSPGKEGVELGNMQSFFVDHPVVARCSLAVFLCAIVLPGWIYYIVPPARKEWRHHLEDILLAERQVPCKRQARSYDHEE